MTSQEIKALQDSNLATNDANEITAAKLREVTTELIKNDGGVSYYVNSTTTPQSATTDVQIQLTHDAAGYTVTTYKPYYVTSPLLSGNAIQLSELPNGAIVNFRFEGEAIVPNATEVKFTTKVKNSSGDVVFTLPFLDLYFKTAGTKPCVANNFFFVDTDIAGGSVEFYYTADGNSTVLFKNLVINITT